MVQNPRIHQGTRIAIEELKTQAQERIRSILKASK
jgi:hypothetical protein